MMDVMSCVVHEACFFAGPHTVTTAVTVTSDLHIKLHHMFTYSKLSVKIILAQFFHGHCRQARF